MTVTPAAPLRGRHPILAHRAWITPTATPTAVPATTMTRTHDGRNGRRLTDEQEAEIAARYRDKESTTSLASAYGLCAQTICDVLHRRGEPRRSRSESARIASSGSAWTQGRVLKECAEFIEKYGEASFVETSLIAQDCSQLAVAVNNRLGGFPSARKLLNLGQRGERRLVTPKRSAGHWTREVVLSECELFLAEHGADMFSQKKMSGLGQGALAKVIQTELGGFIAARRIFGLTRTQKPKGYWTRETTAAACRDFLSEYGAEVFTTTGLTRLKKRSLLEAVTQHLGGITAARREFGLPPTRRSSGYWTRETTIAHCRAFLAKHGAENFTAPFIAKTEGGDSLLNAIGRFLCGVCAARETLGLDPVFKRPGYWNKEVILEKARTFLSEHGADNFTYQRVKELGEPGLNDAVQVYFGGFPVARQELGLPPLSATILDHATALTAELEQLIESLGDHIHDLPAKSWLRIVRQVEALQAIGRRSALHPIKMQLLSGQVGPDDIVLSAPAVDAEVDVDDAEQAPTSKLREALAAIVAGAGDDVEEGDTESESDDTVAEADPAETTVDVQDDPESVRARLLNLSPERRLNAVSAAARACGDEAVLRGITHAQTEQLWTQLFATTDPDGLVAEVRAAQPADAWSALVRDSFLSDYRLIEEITEIPGLVLPKSFTLNLMQRREAALLLRDRRRLNLSGMGAGKTLSAIAGAQLAGLKRVLVVCPNNAISNWQTQLGNHLPSAAVAAKTWSPIWQRDDCPRWLLVNHEMLGDRGADGLAMFLHEEQPEFVVIDELHQCKMRDQKTESQRHRNLAEMARRIREQDGFLYGMTGTLVVNGSNEAVDMLALVSPGLAQGLSTKHTVDDCLTIHEALQPISTRYLPPPAAEVVERTIEVRADHLFEEVLDASQRSLTTVDAVLVGAKVDALVALATEPGKLLVFTSAVTGVVGVVQQAFRTAGIGCALFTGDEKDHGGVASTHAFATDPGVKVLLATTSCLSTGFDGLQFAAGRVAFLTLPWTAADREQAVARVLRQGCAFGQVEVTTIVATLTDPETEEDWSLDEQKLERLTTKRSVAAAVVDGVIPEAAALRTFNESTVRKAVRTWAQRVRQQRQQEVSA